MKKLLVSLLILVAFVTSFSAGLPRNETVYILGALWGPATTWNLYAPQSTYGTEQFLYVPLFLYGSGKDVWLPILGESYEFLNPTTIRIKIRDEAKWSDGVPITAEDVVFTFELTKKMNFGPGAGWETYVSTVTAIDEKTVEFKANEEKINYFQFLNYALAAKPVPAHVYKSLSEKGINIRDWKNDNPNNQVVSGPYKLFYSGPNLVAYGRIENWWGKDIFGLPRPKYLANVIYRDNPSAVLAFQGGAADWGGLFIPKIEDLWKVKKLPVGTWYSEEPYFMPDGVGFLYINNAKEQLNDPALKRAIAYAIPYQEMLRKAYFGYGSQAHPSMVIDLFEANKRWIDYDLARKVWGTEDGRVPTDLEMANKILDEAGYKRGPDGIRVDKNGNKLGTFTLSVPYGWTDWMMMCEMIAKNLREIGIDVQTEFPDYSVWADRMTKGTFDFIISWSVGAGFDHPYNIYRFVMDSRLTGPVGESHWAGDWERYNNPEVLEILDNVVSTLDENKLKESYSKLQEIIYRDLPSIPAFYTAHWYEYTEFVWTNWPNENNPSWFPASPWHNNSLPVTFIITNKDNPQGTPEWLNTIDNGGLLIPSSKIFEDLNASSK